VGFLSLDGTFWIQLVNFAIFFALLNLVFLKPVGEGVRKRREYLDNLTSERDALQTEGVTLRAQADAERQAARRDAHVALTRSRAAASNEASDVASEYNRQAAERIAAAHGTAESELQAASTNSDKLAGDLAALVLDRTLSGVSS
jgi:F0F1-type ATP synthase membrane subunit b/b'